MIIKYRWLILVFSLLTATGFAAEQVKYRLLLQVSENSMERLNSALNNAHDAQAALGSKNIKIEIVVFGAGVNTLKHQAPIPNADKAKIIADKVKEAKEAGVRIVACDSTMQLLKLHPADLLPEVQYVKSGVIELIEKQTEGWSYVRP